MKIVKYACLVTLLSGSTLANAEPGKVGIAFEVGAHGGGDEFTAVSTTSGTKTVTAGGGISLAVGAKMDLSDDLSLQTTVGYKGDAVNGSNGNITFSRSTIDVLMDMKVNDLFYFGGGLTYHMSPKLAADGVGTTYVRNEEFNNALGFLADAKFDIGQPGDFYISLRMTFIDYDSKNAINGKKSYSGNSLGLIWGGSF